MKTCLVVFGDFSALFSWLIASSSKCCIIPWSLSLPWKITKYFVENPSSLYLDNLPLLDVSRKMTKDKWRNWAHDKWRNSANLFVGLKILSEEECNDSLSCITLLRDSLLCWERKQVQNTMQLMIQGLW